MDDAVEAQALVKHYRSRTGVVKAVRGVDLRVQAGEIFGFLGPNGAGKSTMIRMLTTLLSITSGTARVAGVDVAREPDTARHRMGVALQDEAPAHLATALVHPARGAVPRRADDRARSREPAHGVG